MRILDATCGAKSFWYQKNHPFVTYMDIRREKVNTSGIGKLKDRRILNIKPDVIADFTMAPFKGDSFDMIVFDPPHIICEGKTKPSHLKSKYGYLLKENYKQILRNGIKELFRILKPKGAFIFKWAETNKKMEEILKLSPYLPLFGTRTGQANATYWVFFIKYNLNKNLETFGGDINDSETD